MLLWSPIFRKFHANEGLLETYAYHDMIEERQPLFVESILSRVGGVVYFLKS